MGSIGFECEVNQPLYFRSDTDAIVNQNIQFLQNIANECNQDVEFSSVSWEDRKILSTTLENGAGILNNMIVVINGGAVATFVGSLLNGQYAITLVDTNINYCDEDNNAVDRLNNIMTNHFNSPDINQCDFPTEEHTTTRSASTNYPTVMPTIGFKCNVNERLYFRFDVEAFANKNVQYLQTIANGCNQDVEFSFKTDSPGRFYLTVKSADGVDILNNMIGVIDQGAPTTFSGGSFIRLSICNNVTQLK